MAIKYNSTEISTQNVEYKSNRKREPKEGTERRNWKKEPKEGTETYKIKILNIRINNKQSIKKSLLTFHY